MDGNKNNKIKNFAVGPSSHTIICPHCGESVQTRVEFKPTLWTYILSCVLCPILCPRESNMMNSHDDSSVSKRPTHKEAMMIACPSCGQSGFSDVHDEMGRLHAVSILIIMSIFTDGTYQFRNNKLPYGFERNHYCSHCGCYIGTSGKVKSVL